MRSPLLSALLLLVVLACITSIGVDARRDPMQMRPLLRRAPHTAAAAAAAAAPPATTKLFIHSRLIEFVQSIVNSILTSGMEYLPLPPMTGMPATLGTLDFTNIVLTDTRFNAQQVGLIPTSQVAIQIDNVQGVLNLDYTYHGPLGVTVSGHASADFNETTLKTLWSLSSSEVGAPVISMDSLTVSIGQLDVHVTGSLAWLINFIESLFHSTVISMVEAAIQKDAGDIFTSLSQAIEQYWPLKLALPAPLNSTQLNLPLVPLLPGANELPFTNVGNFLVAAAELDFSSLTNSTTDPRPHVPIATDAPLNPISQEPMFAVTMSESVLGSLLFTMQQNGMFNFDVTNADIPPNSLLRLTTALFANEMPSLWSVYPHKNVSLSFAPFSASNPPSSTDHAMPAPGGVTFSNAMTMTLSVVDATPTAPLVPVVQIMFDASIDTALGLLQNTTGIYVTGKVAPLELKGQVLWAALDPGQIASALTGLVSALVNDLLLPLVESQLASGVRIGTGTLEVFPLSNTFVTYGEHIVSFGFDIHMPPRPQDQLRAVQIVDDFRIKDDRKE